MNEGLKSRLHTIRKGITAVLLCRWDTVKQQEHGLNSNYGTLRNEAYTLCEYAPDLPSIPAVTYEPNHDLQCLLEWCDNALGNRKTPPLDEPVISLREFLIKYTDISDDPKAIDSMIRQIEAIDAKHNILPKPVNSPTG